MAIAMKKRHRPISATGDSLPWDNDLRQDVEWMMTAFLVVRKVWGGWGKRCGEAWATVPSSLRSKTMKGSAGTSHIYPLLKSFFSNKVGSLFCISSNKYWRLDAKLEKKTVEAIKHRGASGKNTFRSINSIIMRFPQFREELKNIKSMFEQCDEDSNGILDHEELKKCLSKLQLQVTEKEMEELVHSCDFDGNEGMQFNEFIVLFCLIYLLMEPSRSSQTTSKMGSPQLDATFDTIVQAFLFLDKNGDGKLNKNDMVKALNEGTPWEKSPAHITKTRFKEMDWDKKGRISFKEFIFALTNWVGIDSDDEREVPIL
ncbi:hypothetical protein NE237_016280 [Protea cynaroides]|uniref:EF-hand domain-containing protein n=1 Tax=Protea cynaroides TaxID=273540 RepID=A0A9Q0KFY6_9MAGN|nr:hypothetical protein NE237_016280 [Protea cynaroides]